MAKIAQRVVIFCYDKDCRDGQDHMTRLESMGSFPTYDRCEENEILVLGLCLLQKQYR